MKIRNQNLRIAMKAYVSAALEFVAERAKQATDSSGSEDLDFYWVHTRYSSDLTEVPQYKRCLRELADDREISKHLNQNVGSYSRGGHTPPIEKMMNRVLDLGRRDTSYDFDSERFEKEYLLFEETFYSEVLSCEAIAPLQGLLLDVPAVSLAHGTEISQLEEEEMKAYRARGSHWDNRWCAVRVNYQLPKVIDDKDGEDRFPQIQKERVIEDQANERIEEVVNALRLMGKCDVYHSGIIHQTSKWLSIQHHSVANRVLGAGFITYAFGERDAQLLKLLWDRLESRVVREELGVAVRRFGDSCVRHRHEDKLIDLMIAAESLFLRGTKEGEKSFRLALRAAQFLGEGAASKEIYDRMRLAYYYRSVLVHGGKPSSDRKLKKLDLMKFAGEVGDDIQATIFKALNLLGTAEIGGNLYHFDEKLPTSILVETPMVLFGQRNKLTTEGPFLDLLKQFDEQLQQTERLTVVGYSFRDLHINFYISKFLNRYGGKIRIVDPSFETSDVEYVKYLRDLQKNRPDQIEIIKKYAGAALKDLYPV